MAHVAYSHYDYLHPGHARTVQYTQSAGAHHGYAEVERYGPRAYADPRDRERQRHRVPSVPEPAAPEDEEEEDSDEEEEEEEEKKIEVTIEMFNVPEQYQVHHIIGEGAYGAVCSATHVTSGITVAIKRITPFNHAMFAQRTLREIKLLRHFRHENIISILDMIVPTSFDDFTEVYLVQELMETDLHRVIRTQALSDDHCQYFLYQTFRGLKALHSANVIHRDLKPSNLLLNGNCDLKICDFGLARSATAPPPVAGSGNAFLTEYVATRWYRAPEVMLSFKAYTTAIDIWSVGCILAEMINGVPLFPGDDYHTQMCIILSALGTPTVDEYNEITSETSQKYLQNLPFWRKQSFSRMCPEATPLALDLLSNCLTFSPQKRFTVEEALAHPYLDAYHDPADEPGSYPVHPDFFNFEHTKKKKINRQWRDLFKKLIWHEIHTPIPDY